MPLSQGEANQAATVIRKQVGELIDIAALLALIPQGKAGSNSAVLVRLQNTINLLQGTAANIMNDVED